MPQDLTGYNVYYAPDGCCPEFAGFAETLEEAWDFEGCATLPESLWATARAAGHCAGLEAPNTEGEDPESVDWFGEDGYWCAVPVSRAQ